MFLTSPIYTNGGPTFVGCVAPATPRGQRQPGGSHAPKTQAAKGISILRGTNNPSCKSLENDRGLPGNGSSARPFSRLAEFPQLSQVPRIPNPPTEKPKQRRGLSTRVQNSPGCPPPISLIPKGIRDSPEKRSAFCESDTKGGFLHRQLRFA